VTGGFKKIVKSRGIWRYSSIYSETLLREGRSIRQVSALLGNKKRGGIRSSCVSKWEHCWNWKYKDWSNLNTWILVNLIFYAVCLVRSCCVTWGSVRARTFPLPSLTIINTSLNTSFFTSLASFTPLSFLSDQSLFYFSFFIILLFR
jgi:hypothetical protein